MGVPLLPLTPPCLGIAAPASGCGEKELVQGIRMLREMGFAIRQAPHLTGGTGYLAASDTDRARALMDLWTDPEVGGILCARGGYGCLRIVDLLDYGAIRRHPKVLIGFSDATVLLHAFRTQAGLVTFHGPTVSTLGTVNEASRTRFAEVLKSSHIPPCSWERAELLSGGDAEGMLLGGNLTVLCHLVGTVYEPDYADAVVFLEDVREPAYRIDRALTHLKLSGRMDSIAALLLGRFTGCGRMDLVYKRVLELWGDAGVPIWAGIPVGHGKENVLLPVGARVRLDARRRRIEFFHE